MTVPSEKDELPGMLELAIGVRAQRWPHTMDAQEWARQWMATPNRLEQANDEGAMLAWLANAIMAGFDTARFDLPSKYRVWSCKIVVEANANLPSAFDGPPRTAACEAVEAAGVKVLGCFSGWGGELTEGELRVMEQP